MRKLKIGGITYKVVMTDQFDDECGRLDRTLNTIFLSKHYPTSQQNVTLIHEVLHCLNSELKEAEVEYLAQALYQILSDNDLI